MTEMAMRAAPRPGRVVVQVLLGDAHAPHVDGQRALRLGRAGDELGRAAADVDDEERPVSRVEVSRGADERQASFFVARQQLGPTPTISFATVKKSSRFAASRAAEVAVMRTRPHPSSSIAERNSRSTTAVRSMASGASSFVAFTP